MEVIAGTEARYVSTNVNSYQKALHLLSDAVELALWYGFFYNRLTKQIKRGKLSALGFEQAQVSRYAFLRGSITELNKLVDTQKESWNLEKLFFEWARFEKNRAKQKLARQSIEIFTSRFVGGKELRNTQFAHISKKSSTTTIIAYPRQIPYLQEAVDVLDHFVSSPIPYRVHLSASLRVLDLRKQLGLKSKP